MGVQETWAKPTVECVLLSAFRIGLFVVYTLKPSSVSEEADLCGQSPRTLPCPVGKTFPRSQSDGCRGDIIGHSGTCCGAGLSARLREGRGRSPPGNRGGLLFLRRCLPRPQLYEPQVKTNRMFFLHNLGWLQVLRDNSSLEISRRRLLAPASASLPWRAPSFSAL